MQVNPQIQVDLTCGEPVAANGVLVTQSAAFNDLVVWRGSPGGIAIFCNEQIASANTSTALLTFPLSLDWQVCRGLGMAGGSRVPSLGCIWEPAPVFIGTTNIASKAQLAREGLMVQITGGIGEFWLLRGRLTSATGTQVNVSLCAQRCNGCVAGAVPRIDVGNFVG